MARTPVLSLLVCGAMALAGCSEREFSIFGFDKGVNIAGANEMFEQDIEEFDDVRFAEILDPSGKRFQPDIFAHIYSGATVAKVGTARQAFRSAETAVFAAEKRRNDLRDRLTEAQKDPEIARLRATVDELRQRTSTFRAQADSIRLIAEKARIDASLATAARALAEAKSKAPDLSAASKKLLTDALDKQKEAETASKERAKIEQERADKAKAAVTELETEIVTAEVALRTAEAKTVAGIRSQLATANNELTSKNAEKKAREETLGLLLKQMEDDRSDVRTDTNMRMSPVTPETARQAWQKAQTAASETREKLNALRKELAAAKEAPELSGARVIAISRRERAAALRRKADDLQAWAEELEIARNLAKTERAHAEAHLIDVRRQQGGHTGPQDPAQRETTPQKTDPQPTPPPKPQPQDAGAHAAAPREAMQQEIAQQEAARLRAAQQEFETMDMAANAAKERAANARRIANAAVVKATNMETVAKTAQETFETAEAKALAGYRSQIRAAEQEQATNEAESKRIRELLEDAMRANADDESRRLDREFEQALAVANTYGDAKSHRNRIQNRLLFASQQRCNYYKGYLRRVDSYVGFGFGSLTTILGGASAIVTGATAARVLGGTAGITAGLDATFDQEFFRDLAIHVITPGIDLRRKRLLDEILAKQGRSIEAYNVEAAIHDALDYHNQCALGAGLEEARDLIRETDNIGLKTALDTIQQVEKLRRSTQRLGSETEAAIIDTELPLTVFTKVKGDIGRRNGELDASLKALQKFVDYREGIEDGLTDAVQGLQQAFKTADDALNDAERTEAANVTTAYLDAKGKGNAGETRVQALVARSLNEKYRVLADDFDAAANGIALSLEGIEQEVRQALIADVRAFDTPAQLQDFGNAFGITFTNEAEFDFKAAEYIRIVDLPTLEKIKGTVVRIKGAGGG